MLKNSNHEAEGLLRKRKYTWAIPNFTELSKEVDFMVESPPFDLLDKTWCLQIYPNGIREFETDKRVTVNLVRLDDNEEEDEKKIWYNIYLVGHDEELIDFSSPRPHYRELMDCTQVMGHATREDLQAVATRALDSSLTLTCIINELS